MNGSDPGPEEKKGRDANPGGGSDVEVDIEKRDPDDPWARGAADARAAPPPGQWPAGRRRREAFRVSPRGTARGGRGGGARTVCSFPIRKFVTQTSVVVAQYLHERGTLWKKGSLRGRTHASKGATDAVPGRPPIDRPRCEAAPDRCGQVHKGTGGMPRRHQTDVGVEGCEKSGGAAQ